MSAIDELKRVEAYFYAVVQEMLEGLNLPQDQYNALERKLADSMLVYCQTLKDTSKSSMDEPGKHYIMLTSQIPLQIGFFGAVLKDYRKRRNL